MTSVPSGRRPSAAPEVPGSSSQSAPDSIAVEKKRFAVVGDLQPTSGLEVWRESNHAERRTIVRAIAREQPDFLALLGDLVFCGSSEAAWADFDRLCAPLRSEKIHAIPVLGNHEYWVKRRLALANFFARFPDLRGRHWHAASYGPLGLIFLDSNYHWMSAALWQAQLSWYREALGRFDADPSTRGVLVFLHHPPFTNSRVTSDTMHVQRDLLGPFQQAEKTMAMISGHVHSYERFERSGKVFLVTGGGGGPRVSLSEGPAAAPLRRCFRRSGPARIPLHERGPRRDGPRRRGAGPGEGGRDLLSDGPVRARMAVFRPSGGGAVSYLGDSSVRARLRGILRAWLEGDPPLLGPRRNVLVIGHRGTPRYEAENTLPSFRRALEQGANAIETDVCVTRDGHFVLWHDADPDDAVALVRQTTGEGLVFRPEVPAPGSPLRRPVRELDLEELRRHYRYVRAPGSAPGGATPAPDAPIATLAELLAWAPGQHRLSDVLLDIKLEADQTAEAVALFDLLARKIDKGELPDLTLRLLSPQAEIVSALVECSRRRTSANTRLRVSADFELPGAPELGPRTGARDVSLGCGQRAWIAFRRDVAHCVAARDRGAFDCVIAWTISDAERLRELVCLGTDGILTDDVATLRWLVVDTRHSPPGERARARKPFRLRVPWPLVPGFRRAKPSTFSKAGMRRPASEGE